VISKGSRSGLGRLGRPFCDVQRDLNDLWCTNGLVGRAVVCCDGHLPFTGETEIAQAGGDTVRVTGIDCGLPAAASPELTMPVMVIVPV
jgi:hypothetical protein